MPQDTTLAPRYTAPTRLLHWVVAVMVISTFMVAYAMLDDRLPRNLRDTLFILHKNGGVLILIFVVLRLGWRARHPAPPFPATMPRWQTRAARGAHWLLYTLLMVMAISGYVRVRAGGFPIEALDALGAPLVVPQSDALADTAKFIHANARYALGGLVLVHVAAALRHLRARDGVFARIWPPLGRGRA